MSINITFTILIFSLTFLKTQAQYALDWQANANNDSKNSSMSVVDTQDNIIITGYTQSAAIFTRKYDLSGTLIWETTDESGIQSQYEKSNWITADSDNNVYVIGHQYAISNNMDIPNAIIVLKYDYTGSLIWKTNIPISILQNNTTTFDCRGLLDSNNNLYIGTAISNGVTLIKVNPDGNLIFSNSSNLFAAKNFNSMRLLNNRIAIATSSGSANVSPIFVWDTTGTLIWSADVGGTTSSDVEIDENGNIYVLGSIYHQINATTWDYDAKITKLTPDGNTIWSQSYDFGGYNFATRMTYVNNKISAIGYGHTSGIKWFTFQTDIDGNLLWSTTYLQNTNPTSTDEYPRSLLANASGEVLVTGVGSPTPIPGSSSYNQMPILQYSNSGALTWLETPNMYAGTGLALMFASDQSLFAIGSRNMFVFHFNSLSQNISANPSLFNSAQLFPNPSCEEITIDLNQCVNSRTTITLYNSFGAEVKSIDLNVLSAGHHVITLNTESLSNGIYFCIVKSGSQINSMKFTKI